MPVPTLEQVELAEETYEFLMEHPDAHDQDTWMSDKVDAKGRPDPLDVVDCGVTGCYAGWAAVFAGHKLVLMPSRLVRLADDQETIFGTAVSRLLGIPDYDTYPLSHPFDGGLTFDQIGAFVHTMRECYERGIDIDTVYLTKMGAQPVEDAVLLDTLQAWRDGVYG